jgi:fibronectin-binding autotransporter adhesin
MSHRAIGLAATAATALTTSATLAAVWVPTAAGTHSWVNNANWNSTPYPDANGAVANLNIDIAGNQIVELNDDITVGELRLGDSSGTSTHTINAGTGGLLRFNSGSTNAATLTTTGVSNTINAPVVLESALTLNVGSSLRLSGGINNGGNTITLNIASGTTSIYGTTSGTSGNINGAGGLTVNMASGATLRFALGTGGGSGGPGTDHAYKGATAITGGTLLLNQDAVKLSESSSYTFTRTTIAMGNLPNSSDKLRNGSPVALNAATLTLTSDSTSGRSETAGALTFSSGDNNVSHTGGGGSGVVATLIFGATSRSPGATVTHSAPNINSSGSSGSVLRVTTATTAANLNQNGIVPWALANPQLSTGGFAFYTTNGYDEYAAYTNGPITNSSTANFRVSNTTETLAANSQINSLLIDTENGAYTLNGASTSLTIGTAQSGATSGNPNFNTVGAVLSRGHLTTPATATNATINVSSLLFTGEAMIFTEGANHTLTINSPITGTGGLTKSRAGTLVLAGDNDNLDGVVRVNAGTLKVDGSLAHADINILTGATLNGDGSIQWNLAGNVAELITVNGTFAIGGLDLVLGISGSQSATQYVIANYSGGGVVTGATFANVIGLPVGWAIDYDGTLENPNAIVAVIPEPSSLGALVLAGTFLVRRRGSR